MPGLAPSQQLIDNDSENEVDMPAFLFHEAGQNEQARLTNTAAHKSQVRPSGRQVKNLMDSSSDYSVQPPRSRRRHQTDEDDSDDEYLDASLSSMAGQILVRSRSPSAGHLVPVQTDLSMLDYNQQRDGPASKRSALTAMFDEDATPKRKSISSSWERQTQDLDDSFKVAPPGSRPAPSTYHVPQEEAKLIEGFRNKFAGTKFPDQDRTASRLPKLHVQDVFDTLDQETRLKHQDQTQGLAEQFEDLDLSPPTSTSTTPESTTGDNGDEDDWEKIDGAELDEETQVPMPLPSVVYQNATFKATLQECVDRYSLSDEQKETLKGAWTILKWAGEVGYAVVSEPLVEMADWVVKRQFGCELDELPVELRMRLMASLPENMQTAIRVTNRVAGHSAEVAVSSYRRLSNAARAVQEATRALQDSDEGIVAPSTTVAIDDLEDEAEIIDELEGMIVGKA